MPLDHLQFLNFHYRQNCPLLAGTLKVSKEERWSMTTPPELWQNQLLGKTIPCCAWCHDSGHTLDTLGLTSQIYLAKVRSIPPKLLFYREISDLNLHTKASAALFDSYRPVTTARSENMETIRY